MNENFKDILVMYKECTLKIIKNVEDDNLDSLEELVKERQCLLEKASNTVYEKEKSRQIYEELHLNELQDKLNTLMSGKLEAIRNKMQEIAISRKANVMYNKRNCCAARIFSKKL